LLNGKIKKQAVIVEKSKRLILFVAFWKIVAVENRIKNNDVDPKSKNNICSEI
jgi:hypothetical protein